MLIVTECLRVCVCVCVKRERVCVRVCICVCARGKCSGGGRFPAVSGNGCGCTDARCLVCCLLCAHRCVHTVNKHVRRRDVAGTSAAAAAVVRVVAC